MLALEDLSTYSQVSPIAWQRVAFFVVDFVLSYVHAGYAYFSRKEIPVARAFAAAPWRPREADVAAAEAARERQRELIRARIAAARLEQERRAQEDLALPPVPAAELAALGRRLGRWQ